MKSQSDTTPLIPATRDPVRLCRYGGTRCAPAAPGSDWCTAEHERYDRGSETTFWRKAVAA